MDLVKDVKKQKEYFYQHQHLPMEAGVSYQIFDDSGDDPADDVC